MVGLTHVLIPGAGSDASYWHALAPLLRERGHDVVTLDLPCDDDRAGLPEYVDIVVEAIGERRNTVVVAQSMAGFTAPLVCKRVPVRQIVLLNAMIPLPGETPGEWWNATGQEAARRKLDLREGRDPDARSTCTPTSCMMCRKKRSKRSASPANNRIRRSARRARSRRGPTYPHTSSWAATIASFRPSSSAESRATASA